MKRMLRSLLDTGRNLTGKLKYNRYKLLTFVLAALVIANALGITGWTVNTITGLEINLPELAWAADPVCDPECLDCQICEEDKDGNTYCVEDCLPGFWCKKSDEICHEKCSGMPPSFCHDCVHGSWVDQCGADQNCQWIDGAYQCSSDCPAPDPEDKLWTECHECDPSSGDWVWGCEPGENACDEGSCEYEPSIPTPHPPGNPGGGPGTGWIFTPPWY